MHQKAILKKRESFEVLKAEKFGIKGGMICFGKLSGKSALLKYLKKINFHLLNKRLIKLCHFLKKEAEKKKILTFSDIKKIAVKIK